MTDEKTKTYQSSVIALPELKMVLVHASNEKQNAAEDDPDESTAKKLDKEKAVRKIIQHLESTEQ
jgi:hypothetical protein